MSKGANLGKVKGLLKKAKRAKAKGNLKRAKALRRKANAVQPCTGRWVPLPGIRELLPPEKIEVFRCSWDDKTEIVYGPPWQRPVLGFVVLTIGYGAMGGQFVRFAPASAHTNDHPERSHWENLRTELPVTESNDPRVKRVTVWSRLDQVGRGHLLGFMGLTTNLFARTTPRANPR